MLKRPQYSQPFALEHTHEPASAVNTLFYVGFALFVLGNQELQIITKL